MPLNPQLLLKWMPQSQVDHFQIFTFMEHFEPLGGDFSTTIKVDGAKTSYLAGDCLDAPVRQFDALPDVESLKCLHVWGEPTDSSVGHVT